MNLKVNEAEIVKNLPEVQAALDKQAADAVASHQAKVDLLNAGMADFEVKIAAAREQIEVERKIADEADAVATAARRKVVDAEMALSGLVSQAKNLVRELVAASAAFNEATAALEARQAA